MSTTGPKAKRFGRPAALGNASEIINPLREQATPAQLIPLDKIDMDSDNIRPLLLDPMSPETIGADSPHATRMKEQLDEIRGLARSIEASGLINAVEVYRRADRYVLATGQRRYLAHRVLGLSMIRASVLMSRPKNLRAQQYIENEQRKNMSLAERIKGIGPVLEEAQKLDASLQDQCDYLVSHLGMSRTTAYRYMMIRSAPADILEAILDGRLTNILKAEALAGIVDDEERALALAALLRGESLESAVELATGPDEAAADGADAGGTDAEVVNTNAIPVKRASGRPPTRIALGTIEQPNVVRGIIRDLLGDEFIPEIDWSDLKAVSKAFQACLPEIAKRYA